MLFVAIRGYIVKNRYGGSSTLVCGLFFVIFGLYNLYVGYLPYPYNGFMVWWIGILLVINLIFALIIHKLVRKIELEKLNTKSVSNVATKKWSLRNYLLIMSEEDPYQERIPIKMEAYRKSFHLAGFLFLFAYFGFFFIPPLTQIVNETVIVFINDIGWYYTSLWGDPKYYPYTKNDFQAVIDLTMFAFIGALIFSIIPDLIRIIAGPKYSIMNFLTKSILRNKELNAVGPHIYLLSGIIFSYMLYIIGIVHVFVVITGILIACFSDALAALVGRAYGKYEVKCIGGDIKTVEGFIAGTLSSFLIGLILLGPVYAIIAAVFFFIIDLFPSVIADNITNPLLITLGIHLSFLLLRIPLGWN